MSTEMIQAPVAEDVTDRMQLVARTTGEMRSAQSSLSQWLSGKLSILGGDLDEARENLRIAESNNWKVGGFKSAVRKLEKRIDFYQKCKAASDAGYVIVPNFPCDVFAIRTTRRKPDRMETTWRNDFTQRSEAPRIGDGGFVDAEPVVHTRVNRELKADGTEKKERIYWADHFQDEIDFPVSVATPVVMSATSEAMALKCFDEMGVLPGRKSKGDPIVVGRIRDPRRHQYNDRMVTFLVAWYIDTNEL